ncbi:hypothetical protein D3C80_874240 [compost metagenome]
MFQRDIAKFAGLARIGFLVAVFNRQAAAYQQVKAHQLAVFGNRDKVHVVGVQIDVVLRWDHHRGFEFARQISRPEDRFFVGGRHFFLIQPHFSIGAGTRQQMFGDLFRPLVGFLVQLGLHRVRGAKHVAVDVVSRSQRVQSQTTQQLVNRLNVALHNAMELESLTVGDADAAVQRAFLREFINAQPLLWGDNPPRQTATQHHGVARFQLLFGAFGADITVVLLVHSVEADQQEIVTVKTAGQAVLQVFGDGAAQEVAFFLQTLGIGQFAFDHQRPRVFITHQ